MRLFRLLFCLVLLVAAAAAADDRSDVKSADFGLQTNAVRITMNAGELDIAPSADKQLHVRYSTKADYDVNRVHVKFNAGTTSTLDIDAPSNSNTHVELQVPSPADLDIDLSFGDLEIRGMRGNKSVEMHAGNIEIEVGDARDYGPVDASVKAGNIDADPFGGEKSGLFRHFRYTGPGTYKLHAHTGAGNIEFQGAAKPHKD
jgi:DUF4097 and DUF4098 domain-containing protein YvlB